jgi:hypothetical protein
MIKWEWKILKFSILEDEDVEAEGLVLALLVANMEEPLINLVGTQGPVFTTIERPFFSH